MTSSHGLVLVMRLLVRQVVHVLEAPEVCRDRMAACVVKLNIPQHCCKQRYCYEEIFPPLSRHT